MRTAIYTYGGKCWCANLVNATIEAIEFCRDEIESRGEQLTARFQQIKSSREKIVATFGFVYGKLEPWQSEKINDALSRCDALRVESIERKQPDGFGNFKIVEAVLSLRKEGAPNE